MTRYRSRDGEKQLRVRLCLVSTAVFVCLDCTPLTLSRTQASVVFLMTWASPGEAR